VRGPGGRAAEPTDGRSDVSLAALWFPGGTAGTVLAVLAVICVVAGVVVGRKRGRRRE
jgi:hypothetical protein